MRYIVVTADYNSTGVKEKDGLWLSDSTFKLSEPLWNRIANWVTDYSSIIMMDMPERNVNKQKIADLDKEGLEICKMIKIEKDGEVKVEYYSEGKLEFIHIS